MINGDMVDFLAEDGALAFDPRGAVAKLGRIAGDEAFEPVFAALQEFTATPDRTLVITLGNHDLELALPEVKKKLATLLRKKKDPEATMLLQEEKAPEPTTTLEQEKAPELTRQNLRFAFDGLGFRCRVGGRNVLAVHGNDVDLWNLTDYERLRRIARDLNFGIEPEPWTPNAGSRLVVEVMNEVKREFPFVDLLKPEFEAAVPILLALKPGLTKKLAEVASLIGRRILDGGKRFFDLLGAPENEKQNGEAQLSRILGQQGSRPDELSPDDLLASTEKLLRQPITPAALAELERAGDLLGLEQLTEAWSFFQNRTSQKAIRYFYERHVDDPGFGLSHADRTFRELDAQIGSEIDFLLAGHTHLARDLRRRGGGRYLNSGTWIPLILPKRQAYPLEKDGKGMEKLWRDLKKGRKDLMADRNLVDRLPRIAQVIDRGSGEVEGRLIHLPVGELTPKAGWTDLEARLWGRT